MPAARPGVAQRTWVPTSSCMTMPDVTMGPMPSSMRVPFEDAMIMRAQ